MSVVEKWQGLLDAAFPRGLIVTWDRPDDTAAYVLPRVEVIGQEGLDPVVALPVYGDDRLFTFRVLAYEVIKHEPFVLAHVIGDNISPQWWSGGVNDYHAREMAETRARRVAFAQEHGKSIFA